MHQADWTIDGDSGANKTNAARWRITAPRNEMARI